MLPISNHMFLDERELSQSYQHKTINGSNSTVLWAAQVLSNILDWLIAATTHYKNLGSVIRGQTERENFPFKIQSNFKAMHEN